MLSAGAELSYCLGGHGRTPPPQNFNFLLMLTQFKPNTLTLFSTQPNILKHLGI